MRNILTSCALSAMMAGAGMAQGVIVTDQIDVDGVTTTFRSITAPNDGWVVIHAMRDGQPVLPGSIGHAWVRAGVNTDVKVKTDYVLGNNETYLAMLHDETNGNESYEFGEGRTDVDTPTMVNGQMVAVPFTVVSADATLIVNPAIVTAGIVFDGARVTFPSVTSSDNGYLVLHAMKDGKVVVPDSIGHVAINAGANTAVTVTADYPLVPGESYVAMLHRETNGNATYDFGPGATDVDTPIETAGVPVTSTFTR
jgi:hypothetical protein